MQRIAAEAHFTSRMIFALMGMLHGAFETHLYLSQFRRETITRILHSTAHATPQRAPPKEKHHAPAAPARRRRSVPRWPRLRRIALLAITARRPTQIKKALTRQGSLYLRRKHRARLNPDLRSARNWPRQTSSSASSQSSPPDSRDDDSGSRGNTRAPRHRPSAAATDRYA